VDIKLQEIAEEAFGKFRGALVAIDPSNGEVLAFVSKPGYDPNLFVDGIDTETWDALNSSLDVPLNNRALRGQYPPGPPSSRSWRLRPGLRQTHAELYDQRSRLFQSSGQPSSISRLEGGRARHCGYVQVHRDFVRHLLLRPCHRSGHRRRAHYLERFGFGKGTGLDMNGESAGLLPSQDWKRRRFKQIWYPGDTVSVGIGQGYTLVTPLQLAYATAILANDGIGYRRIWLSRNACRYQARIKARASGPGQTRDDRGDIARRHAAYAVPEQPIPLPEKPAPPR